MSTNRKKSVHLTCTIHVQPQSSTPALVTQVCTCLCWLHWFTLDRLLPAACGGRAGYSLRRLAGLPLCRQRFIEWVNSVTWGVAGASLVLQDLRWESHWRLRFPHTMNSDTSRTLFFESVNYDTFGLIFQKVCNPTE